MGIKSRAFLKNILRRGVWPSISDFATTLESFAHLEEDKKKLVPETTGKPNGHILTLQDGEGAWHLPKLSAADTLRIEKTEERLGAVESAISQNPNLIATYTHSGNKEVRVTAIDFGTNTFTSPGHGLTNTNTLETRVGVALNTDAGFVIPQNVMPFSNMPTIGFFVVNATANTFQLSLTEGGAPVALVNKAGIDLNKWHLERGPHNFLFANPLAISTKMVITGAVLLAYSYYIGRTVLNPATSVFRNNTTSVGNYNVNTIALPAFFAKVVVEDTFSSRPTKVVEADSVRFGTGATVEVINLREALFSFSPADNVLGWRNMLLANGAVVQVFKN